MTTTDQNVQKLRDQSAKMQKLAKIIKKDAKTPKDRLSAQVCLQISQVASLLADYVDAMDKEKSQPAGTHVDCINSREVLSCARPYLLVYQDASAKQLALLSAIDHLKSCQSCQSWAVSEIPESVMGQLTTLDSESLVKLWREELRRV